MIYELTYGGYRLGTFPTEAEAVRRVSSEGALYRPGMGKGWRIFDVRPFDE